MILSENRYPLFRMMRYLPPAGAKSLLLARVTVLETGVAPGKPPWRRPAEPRNFKQL
jgi:hypothetical protein